MMQSPKSIMGLVAIAVFIIGAGFIVVQFGNKSNDAPAADTITQTVPNVAMNQNTIPVTTPVTQTQPITTPKPTTTTTPKPVITTTPKPVTSPYKDGTYSATGTYDSPAGMESILVSVTLKNGVVASSTVTNEAQDRTSGRYQNMFISGYKTYVTGKSITSISLSRVSGSSLTPNGFNQAIAKIKSQAAA